MLSAVVSEGDFVSAWPEATAEFRGSDVPLPQRSEPRAIDPWVYRA